MSHAFNIPPELNQCFLNKKRNEPDGFESKYRHERYMDNKYSSNTNHNCNNNYNHGKYMIQDNYNRNQYSFRQSNYYPSKGYYNGNINFNKQEKRKK